MKQRFFFAMLALTLVLCGMPQKASAQSYNFEEINWPEMIEVFYNALAAGKPYPSDADIEALGISHADLAFIKSHVTKRKTLGDDNRLRPETYANRKLWMNTPMGSGSGGSAGYPSKIFHSDVFSMWNYVSLWGSWNHGICQTPGAWVDAAHKNGADMLSGTVFFDSSHGDESSYFIWKGFFSATGDTSPANYQGYKYVKPIVHMLLYFGMDGININWEAGQPSEATSFHKALNSYAKSIGFDNFHVGLYSYASSLSNYNVQSLYAQNDGLVADYMMNYGSEALIGSSARAAKNANAEIGTSRLYKGFWIVRMDQDWESLDDDDDAHEVNICLWGEHKMSRFWSYNSGAGAWDAQANYQTLQERAFTGGTRNPLKRLPVNSTGNNWEWQGQTPPLNTFCGFSEWIPERSSVSGKLPFCTDFCLGNGDRYNYYGKQSSGSWYNMSAQDVMPTYRWLVLNKLGDAQQVKDGTVSTAIDVTFTHNDAYNGGSCIELKGDASQATDIVLYSTDLTPNDAEARAIVAIKGAGEREEGEVKSNLSLLLMVNGSWREYAIPNNKGITWEEHGIKLNLGTGDKITKIGLRVQGGEPNYDMYVGKIELNDGHKVAPNEISQLEIKKTGESPTTIDVKMNWDVDVVPDAYGLGHNEEANIDHFVILVKDGVDGTIREIGRTSQWATFVGNVDVKEMQEPYFGVAAVSTDLKTFGTPLWERVEKNPNGSGGEDEDPWGTYGESSANKEAEGYANALKVRGVERFKTSGAKQDVDFQQTFLEYTKEQKETDGIMYHKVKGQTLEVEQGSTIDFMLKGFDGQGNYIDEDGTEKPIGEGDDLRWCFCGGWMDFDGSGTFNYGKGMTPQLFWRMRGGSPETETNQAILDADLDYSSDDGTQKFGERVFRYGTLRCGNYIFVKNEGVKGKITIPDDAHLGPSRLRIVWSDAWFGGEFNPTGRTNKGYTLDIDVNIVGTNEANQRMPLDLHDKGPVADWTVMTDIQDVSETNGKAPALIVKNGTLYFQNTAQATVYTIDGKVMKTLRKPGTVVGTTLGSGVFIVKLVNGSHAKNVKIVL